MKLKLKVTAAEFGALIKIAGAFVKGHSGVSENLLTHSYLYALEGFIMRQLSRMVGASSAKSKTLTFTDMETLAFYDLCKEFTDGSVPPYEMALSQKVMDVVAKQMDREEMMRMSIKQV